MIPQFKHYLTSSFVQWFEHTLISEGRCFTNFTGKFYEMPGARRAGAIYSTAFGQFVHDNSISGAIIPSGVHVNGNFVARGTSGLYIDFLNGRVGMTGVSNANVTGAFAVKEFEVLYTTRPEDEVVLASQFSTKPKSVVPFTGRAETEILAPCVLISKVSANEEPFEFGGTNTSVNHYRALILATTDHQLDGMDSIFTDKKFSNFAYLTTSPWNEQGDLKGGSYNYLSGVALAAPNRLVYISDVTFSKFSSSMNKALNPKLMLGVLEFTLEITR